jgi:hypothetical protein
MSLEHDGTRALAAAVMPYVTMRRVLVVCLACVLASVLAGSARAFASRGHCGPALCIRTDKGWFGSVGPGVANAHPAAWVLFGNFRFPADAAGHEGHPSVPGGRLLIAFSDFPVVGRYARWRRATYLHLPARHPTRKRLVTWHVRFAGRAVYVEVKFGSRPSAPMWRLANAKLATVHRKQR